MCSIHRCMSLQQRHIRGNTSNFTRQPTDWSHDFFKHTGKKTSYHSWWRHQMETFSALLAICAGNSPVTGEFPAQRPVTRSFDVFLRLNQRLSKQSWGWWFETPSRPLWRHCNVVTLDAVPRWLRTRHSNGESVLMGFHVMVRALQVGSGCHVTTNRLLRGQETCFLGPGGGFNISIYVYMKSD